MSDFVSCYDLLANDHSGRGLKQIQEEFFSMRSDIKKAMDAGLSSDDMSIARRAQDAVDAASQATDKLYSIWNS